MREENENCTIPSGLRLWHFVSNRDLSHEEQLSMSKQMLEFLESWNAHGSNLTASHKWFHNRILSVVLEVSKGSASGCSIDAMKSFVHNFQDFHNFSWGENNLFYVFSEGKLKGLTRKEFKEEYKLGKITNQSVVFDSLLLNTENASPQRLFPSLEDSWHVKLV